MVEITYHKEGDFFVPDLYLEKEDYKNDYQNNTKYVKCYSLEELIRNILIVIPFALARTPNT